VRAASVSSASGSGWSASSPLLRPGTPSPTAETSRIVSELVTALAKLRAVLESREAEERKAVVRSFLRGITINKKADQATLTWFRLPALQNVGLKLVELRGVEPLTPRLPALCSPN
jgi:hypothetical protein